MEKLKKLFLSFVLLSVSMLMYAQTEINGTVVDTKGETIIGATVMEKGTSNGTITDFDGNFTIKVKARCCKRWLLLVIPPSVRPI